MSKRKGIPAGFNEESMRAMREVLEDILGERGRAQDTAVTRGDLVRAGIARMSAGGQLVAVRSGEGGSNIQLDPLTNLQAAPVGTNIVLQWGNERQEGLDHTEVWRGDIDDLDTARFIARVPGDIYTDPVGSGQGFYYWVRPVSSAGDKFAFNSANGTFGET